MASFAAPEVHVNMDGWGPTDLPERYKSLPFAQFSKRDPLGTIGDFTLRNKQWQRQNIRDKEPSTGNALDDDGSVAGGGQDDVFQLVDDSTNKRDPNRAPAWRGRGRGRGRGGFGWNARGRGGRRGNDIEQPLVQGKKAKFLVQHTRRGKQWRGRGNQRRWNNNRNQPTLEASVRIGNEWNKLEEFDVSALTKLSMAAPKAEDLRTCGHVFRYADQLDRVSTRLSTKLQRFSNVQFTNATTIDDPVIQAYAQEYARKHAERADDDPEKKQRVVFATDELLAHLMTCPRSALPWDVYFTRMENGLLFLDKREDSGLEMLTVNETVSQQQLAIVAEQEEKGKLTVPLFDKPDKLSIEATAVQQNFSQQAVNREGKRKDFPDPNPFWDPEDEPEGAEPAGFAYKYRRWQLGEGLTLVARTELHACQLKSKTAPGKKGLNYMTLYALNEANPRLSGAPAWRSKIDSARGSVMATEMKNNAAKLGRWTAQSLLAGADMMKVGFVSRASVKDPLNHVVLGTQGYKPLDMAKQVNLKQKNMWGIVKALVDKVFDQPPGKYVLLKEPNKPVLQFFAVPMSFNEDDDDEEDDMQGEGDEGDEEDDFDVDEE